MQRSALSAATPGAGPSSFRSFTTCRLIRATEPSAVRSLSIAASRRESSSQFSTRHSSSLSLSSRSYSSDASSSNNNANGGKPSSSTWDHIFEGVDPVANASVGRIRRGFPPSAIPPNTLPPSPSSSSDSPDVAKFPRRQSLTHQESAIFNQLFEKIFASSPRRHTPGARSNSGRDPLSDVAIGLKPGEARTSVDALFGKLRRRSKRYFDPTESHLVVEQHRVTMESFRTDRELLEWAVQVVFNNNDPNSFPARVPAISFGKRASTSAPKDMTKDVVVEASVAPEVDEEEQARQFALQSSVYPHLLASLISLFRDKFRSPHTALAVFSAARHISVPSYVFGCTTAVYHELLDTKWGALRDLEGFVESLAEMKTNGVLYNDWTRRVAGRVKREAMALASASSPSSSTQPLDREREAQNIHSQIASDVYGSAQHADASWSANLAMESASLWPDVPVDHPTRFLIAQIDELLFEPPTRNEVLRRARRVRREPSERDGNGRTGKEEALDGPGAPWRRRDDRGRDDHEQDGLELV